MIDTTNLYLDDQEKPIKTRWEYSRKCWWLWLRLELRDIGRHIWEMMFMRKGAG